MTYFQCRKFEVPPSCSSSLTSSDNVKLTSLTSEYGSDPDDKVGRASSGTCFADSQVVPVPRRVRRNRWWEEENQKRGAKRKKRKCSSDHKCRKMGTAPEIANPRKKWKSNSESEKAECQSGLTASQDCTSQQEVNMQSPVLESATNVDLSSSMNGGALNFNIAGMQENVLSLMEEEREVSYNVDQATRVYLITHFTNVNNNLKQQHDAELSQLRKTLEEQHLILKRENQCILLQRKNLMYLNFKRKMEKTRKAAADRIKANRLRIGELKDEIRYLHGANTKKEDHLKDLRRENKELKRKVNKMKEREFCMKTCIADVQKKLERAWEPPPCNGQYMTSNKKILASESIALKAEVNMGPQCSHPNLEDTQVELNIMKQKFQAMKLDRVKMAQAYRMANQLRMQEKLEFDSALSLKEIELIMLREKLEEVVKTAEKNENTVQANGESDVALQQKNHETKTNRRMSEECKQKLENERAEFSLAMTIKDSRIKTLHEKIEEKRREHIRASDAANQLRMQDQMEFHSTLLLKENELHRLRDKLKKMQKSTPKSTNEYQENIAKTKYESNVDLQQKGGEMRDSVTSNKAKTCEIAQSEREKEKTGFKLVLQLKDDSLHKISKELSASEDAHFARMLEKTELESALQSKHSEGTKLNENITELSRKNASKNLEQSLHETETNENLLKMTISKLENILLLKEDEVKKLREEMSQIRAGFTVILEEEISEKKIAENAFSLKMQAKDSEIQLLKEKLLEMTFSGIKNNEQTPQVEFSCKQITAKLEEEAAIVSMKKDYLHNKAGNRLFKALEGDKVEKPQKMQLRKRQKQQQQQKLEQEEKEERLEQQQKPNQDSLKRVQAQQKQKQKKTIEKKLRNQTDKLPHLKQLEEGCKVSTAAAEPKFVFVMQDTEGIDVASLNMSLLIDLPLATLQEEKSCSTTV